MSVTIELAVEDPFWAALDDLQGLTERGVMAALAEANALPEESTELSCLFCDDATIRGLNRQWRGKDEATNVLSFPAAGPGAASMLGDIVLSYGTVAREALAEGKSLEDHVLHLVIHGTLHLVGHDHEVDAEAEAMERLEARAMARLGRADPYGAPSPAPAAKRAATPEGPALLPRGAA